MDFRCESFETQRAKRCEMPIYEYACEKCDREFEVEQRITDDPIKTCPHCKSKKIKRLISRTSFVLKGGGWYSDLYSSSGAKDKKGDEGGKADSGDGKAESGSTDSKTESKKDSKSSDTSKVKDKPSAKSKGKGGKAAKR
jgi:putative FmdB family regulatory protein